MFEFLDTLEIAGDFASIESKSLWGALRALGLFTLYACIFVKLKNISK
jgi:hypothetical protein